MRVCRSPWLIAAYHGLPRLRVPRHPPHAFTRLTTTSLLKQSAYNRPKPSPAFQRRPPRCDTRHQCNPMIRSTAQSCISYDIECQSVHPSLDEMLPFNKDSQIRDLPLLPLSNSVDA